VGVNSSTKITDNNITLYAPCLKHIKYGPKNLCAWILDVDVLKYYWEVNTTAQWTSSREPACAVDAQKTCDMCTATSLSVRASREFHSTFCDVLLVYSVS
jgi:hypothetical protein